MTSEIQQVLSSLANDDSYRTADLDSARRHISALFVPHRLEVVGADEVLDVCIGSTEIENVSLIYHRHGASVRVRPEPLQHFFLLQIPICGNAYVRIDQEELVCSSDQALMISPSSRVDMTFSHGCEHLIVRIEKDDLERQLERQLGRPVAKPLQFSAAIPLARPSLQEIKALLWMMASSKSRGRHICSSVIGRKHMVSLLHTALITCLDHNYQDELMRVSSRCQPAWVKKAQEYIHTNIAEPLSPEDIAAAIHVSTRALFTGFKIALNTSPMRYLQQLRLDIAHDSLANQDALCASVTEVALRHGFVHMGRFSQAYKKRFGELPHQTLGKRLPPGGCRAKRTALSRI